MARGVDETRDLILQFYITLQRMLTGNVGLSNVMGPVGMAHEGARSPAAESTGSSGSSA